MTRRSSRLSGAVDGGFGQQLCLAQRFLNIDGSQVALDACIPVCDFVT